MSLGTGRVHFVKALDTAIEAGSAKVANIVMLGALCKLYNFNKEVMREAVAACVPQKFIELNLKAFELGYERV